MPSYGHIAKRHERELRHRPRVQVRGFTGQDGFDDVLSALCIQTVERERWRGLSESLSSHWFGKARLARKLTELRRKGQMVKAR